MSIPFDARLTRLRQQAAAGALPDWVKEARCVRRRTSYTHPDRDACEGERWDYDPERTYISPGGDTQPNPNWPRCTKCGLRLSFVMTKPRVAKGDGPMKLKPHPSIPGSFMIDDDEEEAR